MKISLPVVVLGVLTFGVEESGVAVIGTCAVTIIRNSNINCSGH